MRPYIYEFVVFYLNNIWYLTTLNKIIYKNLKLILDALRRKELHIKLNKCVFYKKLTCLEIVVSKKGLKMDLKEVKEILEKPIFNNLIKVIRLHEITIFYYNFVIKNLIASLHNHGVYEKMHIQVEGAVQYPFKLLKKKVNNIGFWCY